MLSNIINYNLFSNLLLNFSYLKFIILFLFSVIISITLPLIFLSGLKTDFDLVHKVLTGSGAAYGIYRGLQGQGQGQGQVQGQGQGQG